MVPHQGGDLVVVANNRGGVPIRAMLSTDVQPGVVSMPFGWWNTATEADRGVNALTNPRFSEDGAGSAFFHETLVEVSLADTPDQHTLGDSGIQRYLG